MWNLSTYKLGAHVCAPVIEENQQGFALFHTLYDLISFLKNEMSTQKKKRERQSEAYTVTNEEDKAKLTR
jgi:hypothetical protein